jgi:hypothetical protein
MLVQSRTSGIFHSGDLEDLQPSTMSLLRRTKRPGTSKEKFKINLISVLLASVYQMLETLCFRHDLRAPRATRELC